MTTMTTDTSMNPLTDLRATIRTHWQKYCPRRWATLEAAGRLDEAIEAAARNTEAAVDEQMQRGLSLWEAWEVVREEWAILPAEEDEEEEDWIEPFFWEEELPDEEEEEAYEEGGRAL